VDRTYCTTSILAIATVHEGRPNGHSSAVTARSAPTVRLLESYTDSPRLGMALVGRWRDRAGDGAGERCRRCVDRGFSVGS
jgi:hypothetical protein